MWGCGRINLAQNNFQCRSFVNFLVSKIVWTLASDYC